MWYMCTSVYVRWGGGGERSLHLYGERSTDRYSLLWLLLIIIVIFRQERMSWTTTLISTPTLIIFWTLYSSMVGIAKSSFLHSMLMPASCEGCLMLMVFLYLMVSIHWNWQWSNWGQYAYKDHLYGTHIMTGTVSLRGNETNKSWWIVSK